jgi:MFS family permease
MNITPSLTSLPPPHRKTDGKMSGRILFWAITSALAGFLFGFDTVVISGAEQTLQKLWGLSAGMHGLAMGAALYGTVLGSLIGGWPTDRWGRKAVFAALLTTFFPAMVSALAPGYVFLFFCGMMVLQLLWVKTMVPETKGVPLEEIQKRLGVEA